LHILKQLEWVTPIALEELEAKNLPMSPGVTLKVKGSIGF